MKDSKYLQIETRSSERRQILLDSMDTLSSKGINCSGCTGRCCTSVANSMQCTPLEALEIAKWLKEQEKLKNSLLDKIKQCISDYRLEYEIPTTRGIPFRRTYTCPFFNHGPLGCLLIPEIKPYGCLGFNASVPNVVDGENCHSSQEDLEKRERKWSSWENEQNAELIKILELNWDKKPMPVALLDVMERLDIKWDQD